MPRGVEKTLLGASVLWLLLLPGWHILPRYFSALKRQDTEERDRRLSGVEAKDTHHVVPLKSQGLPWSLAVTVIK